MSSVLWYVHDHGVGHLRRCQAVLPHLRSDVVVASSLPALDRRVPGIRTATLPSDRVERPELGPGPLHYAPRGPVARDRASALLDVMAAHDCSTAVVDVSAETAVLCRLAGLRLVVVRQSGRRDDAPHRLAHDCADVVWVPQHEAVEPGIEDIPSRRCTGAFSRFDQRPPDRERARERLGVAEDQRLVVCLLGAGGSSFPVEAWRAAPPDEVEVAILGLGDRWSTGSVTSWASVEDPYDHLCAADLVVAGAGWASVHDAASASSRLVVVPEDRPFDEQRVRARALADEGVLLALDRWPVPSDLPDLFDDVGALDVGRWKDIYDRCGAQRAAALIDEVHARG